MEKTKEVEVHSDFIRCIIVHPKEPWVLTCSDDGSIHLWDLDKGFTLIRTYDDHKNFVMKIALNPKDINMFASASMDLRVKIWSFTSNNSHLTLEGHTKGVRCELFDVNDQIFTRKSIEADANILISLGLRAIFITKFL